MTNGRSDGQEASADVSSVEALAVSWSEVDLDTRSVEIDWKLIRIKGERCGGCHGQGRRTASTAQLTSSR